MPSEVGGTSQVRGTRGVALASLALALTALPATTSCMTCTLKGWSEGLMVEIRSSTGSFAAGAYTIGVVADDVAVEFPITLAEMGMTCEATDGQCYTEIDLEADRTLWVRLEGLSSPTEALQLNIHRNNEDGYDGGPRVATVTVSRDGTLLAAFTIEPHYSQREPNGNGCGVATTASAELIVPGAP